MKKICVLMVLALLLCLGAAWAEEGVEIEVIRIDGESVVVLTLESTMLRARSVAMRSAPADGSREGFVLPKLLTLIEEEAYKGILAEKVEVTENVAAIEARAFADCKSLREIVIPPTVLRIDDHAFDGCADVTVYGEKGSEAERIANLYGFVFVDQAAQTSTETPQQLPSPVVLPAAPL